MECSRERAVRKAGRRARGVYQSDAWRARRASLGSAMSREGDTVPGRDWSMGRYVTPRMYQARSPVREITVLKDLKAPHVRSTF